MKNCKNKVIIFGVNDFAQLAYYYLTKDSEYEVVAFCLTNDYFEENKFFCTLAIENFESIELKYPPNLYCFFAPMSPKTMNRTRAKIYEQIKLKGYSLISYVSSKATVFNSKIGENCFILENNTIQPFVEIGNNVILWSGNHIGHHSEIENHVTFTSHVVMSGHCLIKKYSVLGVNATIRDGITIAEATFVGMSASVTKNTEKWSMYVGVPAKKTKSIQ